MQMARMNMILGDIEGDAFGKVYEYFLGKFAVAKGAKGGGVPEHPPRRGSRGAECPH